METIDFSKIEKTKFEMSTRTLKPMIIYLDKRYSREVVDQYLVETGLDRKYLSNENKWISFAYFTLFLEKLVQFTGDPRAPYDAGIYLLSKEAYGSVYSLLIVLKLFGSPKSAYKKLCEISSTYTNIGKFVPISLKKNKAVIKSIYYPGFQQTKLNCLSIQGQLSSIPVFWNLPAAKVKELQCAADGHDSCIYEFSWVPRSLKKNILSTLLVLLYGVELFLFFFQ